jgi:hypothetical protein
MIRTFIAGALCSVLAGNTVPTFLTSAFEDKTIEQTKVEQFDSALRSQYRAMNKGTEQRFEFKHMLNTGKAQQIGTFICNRKDSKDLSKQIEDQFLSDISEEDIKQMQIQRTNIEVIQELALRNLCNE